MVVPGLEPETTYQFSVLAQNKLGTGPFSEVVTVNTLGEYTHYRSTKGSSNEMARKPLMLLYKKITVCKTTTSWITIFNFRRSVNLDSHLLSNIFI